MSKSCISKQVPLLRPTTCLQVNLAVEVLASGTGFEERFPDMAQAGKCIRQTCCCLMGVKEVLRRCYMELLKFTFGLISRLRWNVFFLLPFDPRTWPVSVASWQPIRLCLNPYKIPQAGSHERDSCLGALSQRRGP